MTRCVEPEARAQPSLCDRDQLTSILECPLQIWIPFSKIILENNFWFQKLKPLQTSWKLLPWIRDSQHSGSPGTFGILSPQEPTVHAVGVLLDESPVRVRGNNLWRMVAHCNHLGSSENYWCLGCICQTFWFYQSRVWSKQSLNIFSQVSLIPKFENHCSYQSYNKSD
jgi:hypothetical protein